MPGWLLFTGDRHVFRRSLAEAAARHLPAWAGRLTPHVLRHFCASQLYLGGMSLFAIQELQRLKELAAKSTPQSAE